MCNYVNNNIYCAIFSYYEKVSNSPPVSEEMLFGNYHVPRVCSMHSFLFP